MTILPHLLLTTVGVQALGLHGTDAALAYGFGYGIDLIDHPIKLPLYLRKNGKKNEKHYHWRTPFQEPIALAWIIPLSFYLGTYVPALFFFSHFALDYMVSYDTGLTWDNPNGQPPTTLTHAFASEGTYTVLFYVYNDAADVDALVGSVDAARKRFAV